MVWRDSVCESNPIASYNHSNCDRSDLLLKRAVPCTEKVSHFGTVKPGVKETRETADAMKKVHEGDSQRSMPVHSAEQGHVETEKWAPPFGTFRC